MSCLLVVQSLPAHHGCKSRNPSLDCISCSRLNFSFNEAAALHRGKRPYGEIPVNPTVMLQ